MLTGPRDRNKPRLRVSFRYEPPGRRLSKTVQRQVHGKAAGRTTTTYFIWDGLRLVQEIHDDVPLTCIYSDVQSYEPLACVDGKENPEIFWFHTAANGMPERLTDSEGRTSWEGISTPWGKLLSESNQGVPGYDQNLRLQGQYLDRETGRHYTLFRYDDPDSARFTQQDPVGLAGGVNLYQYAPNPLSWIDPLGLARKCGHAEHASELGYTKTNERSHGQPVYINNKAPSKIKYITPDVDQHNGGFWKAADSVRNLGSRRTRSGTFDINFNRVGD